MNKQPTFLVGQMRVLDMPEQPFFYVQSKPTPMAKLDDELDRIMPLLEAAQAEAGVHGGPIIVRYYWVEAPDTYLMEVGVAVQAGLQPAGEAQVMVLPAYHCASLLHWGSLEGIGEAYNKLMESIKAAGLTQGSEGREWHYYFAGDSSPHNVIGLHLEIRESSS